MLVPTVTPRLARAPPGATHLCLGQSSCLSAKFPAALLCAHQEAASAAVYIVPQNVVALYNALIGFHPCLLRNPSAAIAFCEAGFNCDLSRLRNSDAAKSVARDLAIANRNLPPEADGNTIAEHAITQPRSSDAHV